MSRERDARLLALSGTLTGFPDLRPYTGPTDGVDAELLAADVREALFERDVLLETRARLEAERDALRREVELVREALDYKPYDHVRWQRYIEQRKANEAAGIPPPQEKP